PELPGAPWIGDRPGRQDQFRSPAKPLNDARFFRLGPFQNLLQSFPGAVFMRAMEGRFPPSPWQLPRHRLGRASVHGMFSRPGAPNGVFILFPARASFFFEQPYCDPERFEQSDQIKVQEPRGFLAVGVPLLCALSTFFTPAPGSGGAPFLVSLTF